MDVPDQVHRHADYVRLVEHFGRKIAASIRELDQIAFWEKRNEERILPWKRQRTLLAEHRERAEAARDRAWRDASAAGIEEQHVLEWASVCEHERRAGMGMLDFEIEQAKDEAKR